MTPSDIVEVLGAQNEHKSLPSVFARLCVLFDYVFVMVSILLYTGAVGAMVDLAA